MLVLDQIVLQLLVIGADSVKKTNPDWIQLECFDQLYLDII
jgi:hypothetical protein